MQPKTLQQILSELDTTYNPQIANIRQQQSLIPQATEANIQQAGAKQTQAYEDILGGARRRGLGFSGVPLGEQAKYASTVYAPEVLRARQMGSQQALSLEDAILGINERRMGQALQLQQAEQQRADEYRREQESIRQFNEQLALSKRAASGGGGWSPTAGAIPTAGGQGGGVSEDQAIANEVVGLRGNFQAQIDNYIGALKSAQFGNARDKKKVQIFDQMFPGLKKQATSIMAGGRTTTTGPGVAQYAPKKNLGELAFTSPYAPIIKSKPVQNFWASLQGPK